MRMTDRVAVSDMQMTGEGYLRASARISRTGIQEYMGYEFGKTDDEALKTFRIYRPTDEVFSPETLASWKLKPVTDAHPIENVTAETWRKEAVGIVAEDVRQDGDHTAATLLITDADIANRIQRKGSVELSCGYDCDLDETPGVTADGEPYDAVQRAIRGNHVAIVDQGRCGPSCKVGDKATGSPKIVMLFASRDTQRKLRDYAEGLGFDLTKTHGETTIDPADFDFHATIIATRNPITLPTGEHEFAGIEVTAVGFDSLGADGEVPVLSLDASGALGLMRRLYEDIYRAEPTFADFKPHVSLSYAWSGSPPLDSLTLPDFPIVFDRIVVDDFVPKKIGADAMPQFRDCGGNSRCGCQRNNDPKGQDMTTKTVTVDGKQFQVTADVAAVIEGLQAKIADGNASYDKLKDASAQLAEIVERHNGATAETIAAKDAEIEELKARVPTADQLQALADERASVIADAKSIAPDLDPKGKGLADIRKEASAVALGDDAASLEGKSDDYIVATFDRLVAAAKNSAVDPVTAAFKSGAKDAKVSPRDAYLARTANAWKGA